MVSRGGGSIGLAIHMSVILPLLVSMHIQYVVKDQQRVILLPVLFLFLSCLLDQDLMEWLF